MENLNKTRVTPQIYFLQNILETISKGELRVPNFQRPFQWKPEDMIALFDSIASGYPIGSLLFWKTSEKYESLSFIGPYEIPPANNSTVSYILDGHQRLSTLYGTLTQNSNIKDKDWWWIVYYDLEKQEFCHVRKGPPEPHYLALHSILKTIDFLRESRRIEKECKSSSNLYIERAEKLAQTIREYQIAITQIEGGDTDIAVNIFSRLNSKGLVIAEDRMYSALTYKEGKFNLSRRIDEIQDRFVEYNFTGIRRITIFRAVLAAAGKDIYTRGKLNIFKDENNIDLVRVVDQCEDSILKAVDFLKNSIKVPDDKFLPYNFQLIAFSEFFRLCPSPQKWKMRLLEQWFWVTSFVGIDTSNTSWVTATINDIRKFAYAEDVEFEFTSVRFNEEAQPFPASFNLVSARVRAYVLFLLSLKPKSLDDDSEFDPGEALSKFGYRALHYIIAGNNQLANRILLGQVQYGHARKLLKREEDLFNPSLSKEVLESHVITEDAIKALRDGNLDRFLQLRESELIKLEREFIRSKGVVPYSSLIAREAVVDAE